MTPQQAEAMRLRSTGLTVRQVGDALGIHERAVYSLLKRARESEEEPEGVAAGLDALKAAGARTLWIKTAATKDQPGYSARWDRPQAEQDPQAFLDAIRAGLGDAPRAGHVDPPAGPSDLMAVFPVADLHIGMLADQEETGEAWDTGIAMRTFGAAFQRLVDVTPGAGTALLAQLGDLSHTTDQTNLTESGHQLDADTRFFLILRRSIAVMKGAIEALRRKYPRVIYRGQRGNHDRHSHYAVTAALAEHYRDTPGVEIVESAAEFYVHQFGENLLALHHGDKVRPERLAHFIAAEYAPLWGKTRHRLALAGHVHHAKAQEVGGLVCESVGTIIPRDAWARAAGYTARRGLVSIALHRNDGEVSRARVGVA